MPSLNPTGKILHLTRHGEAEHNVDDDYSIPDAKLTSLGQKQARELHDMCKDNVQTSAQLIVCSPMRRPMETMLLGYPELKERLDSEGKPVYVLDIVQEVEDQPCDTPSYPVSEITRSQDGIFAELDFSTLSPDYATKKGIFHPDNVKDRAKEVRKWLRARPENEIVVVAHGDILRNMVYGENADVKWHNAERRTYTFVSSDDEDAEITRVEEGEHGTHIPPSSREGTPEASS